MNPLDFLVLAHERFPELATKTGEHVFLTLGSTLVAVAIGIPLGIAAWARPGLRGPVMGTVAVLQTVPSLALLAFLLTLTGKIGLVPAVLALVLYALLPVTQNTLTGLEEVPAAVGDAARGLGMTASQELLMVRLPLAAPLILAGVRTAAVIGVGVASLTAFIGAGGLGDFLYRGLSMRNTGLILLGAVPAGLLAVLVDLILGAFHWGVTASRESRIQGSMAARIRPFALASPLLLVLLGVGGWIAGHP